MNQEEFIEFIEWAIENEELAKEMYPEEFQALKEAPSKMEPYKVALMIESIPKHFSGYIAEIDMAFGLQKVELIKNQIRLCKVLLNHGSKEPIFRTALDKVRSRVVFALEYYEGLLKNIQESLTPQGILQERESHQQRKSSEDKDTRPAKPKFMKEAVSKVYEILKPFFNKEHQKQLLNILKTGEDATEQLLFNDNGNRLANAFKQLKMSDFITGCSKKELERWISQNFKYRFRGQVKQYQATYLNDIVSTNKFICNKPLLAIDKNERGDIFIKKA